ncbi:helix-turn-helix domain-containing protein [uncultured Clostridium sp.]|nr:helix-turn-helix domain-containing protein [uncultured Clostridium sp.]
MKIINNKTNIKILKLYKDDPTRSKRKIAICCGVSRSYVYSFIRKYKEIN